MRVLKVVLVFVVLALASAPEMKLIKVTKDIYMVRGINALPSLENRGFMSNAAAVLTKEGWVVIDGLSTPELSKEFVDNLMRVKKAPIVYAILTHYHADHYYGMSTYKEMGAKIIAHEYVKEYYQSGKANQDLFSRNQRTNGLYNNVRLYPPDITIKDRYTLKVGGKVFDIINVAPAHTNNDIIIYMPKEKVLFVGDLVSVNRTPSLVDATASSKGWVQALNTIQSLDIEVIISGHNEPLKKDAINYTMGYLRYLRDNIKKLKDEGKFIDEIKAALSENPYKEAFLYNVIHNMNVEKVFMELDIEE